MYTDAGIAMHVQATVIGGSFLDQHHRSDREEVAMPDHRSARKLTTRCASSLSGVASRLHARADIVIQTNTFIESHVILQRR